MGGLRRVERLRTAVLVLLCVLYPAASYAFPAMGRAWGMYASTSMYRLRVTGRDRAGTLVELPLASIVREASPRVATALVGAEHGRHGSVLSLPSQLASIGQHACRADLDEVTLELEWRASDGAPSQNERAVVPCSQ